MLAELHYTWACALNGHVAPLRLSLYATEAPQLGTVSLT